MLGAVVIWSSVLGLCPGRGSQPAHFHAHALVDLVATQGVQLLLSGPQNRDILRLGLPQQLGPLALQPGLAGLQQEPGHATPGGPQRQQARGQAVQQLPAPGAQRGRCQVIQEQAAQLLSAGPRATARPLRRSTRERVACASPGLAPQRPQQRRGRSP